jgi:hypothetical protein
MTDFLQACRSYSERSEKESPKEWLGLGSKKNQLATD